MNQRNTSAQLEHALSRQYSYCSCCSSQLLNEDSRCLVCRFHPDDFDPEIDYDLGGEA